MVFDEGLAGRIRAIFAVKKGVSEKKMFGGITFMLNGNMSCGVINDLLMARVWDRTVTKHASPCRT